mmetsp:Transcript_135211/g.201074  ORF Transcript_135211/g.201074 Transcript_135211/m.201074 type:complete len:114 (+) Transcript_135211:1715-2056(+)
MTAQHVLMEYLVVQDLLLAHSLQVKITMEMIYIINKHLVLMNVVTNVTQIPIVNHGYFSKVNAISRVVLVQLEAVLIALMENQEVVVVEPIVPMDIVLILVLVLTKNMLKILM